MCSSADRPCCHKNQLSLFLTNNVFKYKFSKITEFINMAAIILCVDDDKTVLTALRTLLSNTIGADCRVEIAESGQEALEIVDDYAAEGRVVDVVISDFIMPQMRGDELLVRLHERNPGMVKILLTGQSDFSGVKRVINEANLYRFIENLSKRRPGADRQNRHGIPRHRSGAAPRDCGT